MTYIFRPPAIVDKVKIRFDELVPYIRRGRSFGFLERYRKMGQVVKVSFPLPSREVPAHVSFTLYETEIAKLYPNGAVTISETIDQHHSQATVWWLARILRDNGYGSGYVWSVDFRYSMDSEPLAGRTFSHG